MIKQSFPFNELLARKEFENANACKHKSFLTNKLKEEFFPFPMHSKRDNQLYSQEFPFSFKRSKTTKTNIFQKRFLYFYKTLKTMNKANLEIYKL